MQTMIAMMNDGDDDDQKNSISIVAMKFHSPNNQPPLSNYYILYVSPSFKNPLPVVSESRFSRS